MDVDTDKLRLLVGEFYTRVRADPVLGPIFENAVEDWNEHLETLTRFWSSVMLGTATYKGRPVPAHMQHLPAIEPWMFDRWLAIWDRTTADLMSPGAAAALQEKAVRIAESLKLALFFRLDPPDRDARAA